MEDDDLPDAIYGLLALWLIAAFAAGLIRGLM
jgi:hypothetical protein